MISKERIFGKRRKRKDRESVREKMRSRGRGIIYKKISLYFKFSIARHIHQETKFFFFLNQLNKKEKKKKENK